VTSQAARAAIGHFDTVVLDCPDPRALAEFYAGLLGQDIADDGDDSWQSLRGDGSGVSLAFQRTTRYIAPHWPDGPPQRMHLDLTVEDFIAAHERAVALGAIPLSPTSPPEPDKTSGFRVYADPVGHPFCLCQMTGRRGDREGRASRHVARHSPPAPQTSRHVTMAGVNSLRSFRAPPRLEE